MPSVEPPVCHCGSHNYSIAFAGSSSRLGLDDFRFEVAVCSACGLARTLPVPDPEQYLDGYSLSTVAGHFAGAVAGDPHSAGNAAWVKERLRGPRLLDVGCHTGNLVAAAIELGLDAEGIDLDPLATAAGRDLGRPIRAAAVADLDGEYDGIVLSHVFEHVLDLDAILGDVERLLSPVGRVFILCPHYRGLVPRLMGERWMAWFPSQHVWHFTPATLCGAVELRSPLRVAACTTRGVLEPPSAGVKGAAKSVVASFARAARWGDQIEAVLERKT